MKKLVPLFFVFFIFLTYSQSLENSNSSILDKANNYIFKDVKNAKKLAGFVAASNASATDKMRAFLILSDVAYLNGDYVGVINNLYKAEGTARLINNSNTKFLMSLYFAKYFRIFGLHYLYKIKIDECNKLLPKLSSKEFLGYDFQSLYDFENTFTSNFPKTNFSSKYSIDLRKHDKWISSVEDCKLRVGELYGDAGKSKDYFSKYLKYNQRYKISNVYTAKAYFLLAQSENKMHLNPLPNLLRADSLLNHYVDNNLKTEVKYAIAMHYLQNNKLPQYQYNIGDYNKLNKDLYSNLGKAKSIIIKHLQIEASDNSFDTFKIQISVASLIFLTISFLGFIITRKKYIDFLKYGNKSILTGSISKASNNNENHNKNSIPEKTEEIILSKLLKFETNKKFLQPSISLISLSKELETNTRYLSEIINHHKNLNFNQYINELRINYIVEKMKTEPIYLNYKILYLAQECGFSSQSTFSIAFKSIMGVSPISYIKSIRDEKKA
ncbi:helix-turn-helix domain-containing protein [Epilithonimonas hispanica]|uniref:HTH araC/xylS-type domain-containing protein n=1 Tax=Epilithonimonas hispanica TaxID=358687 RepID=A0A3D9D043_9FLAO|nr:AraC family transcriptional regulator [Epilithonimonas hispanica]REC71267.1 hypothetical protein DRF58_06965 [Epilithonimonas hispanica]